MMSLWLDCLAVIKHQIGSRKELSAMNQKTILPTANVFLSLACASLLFLNWNPEALFRQEEYHTILLLLRFGDAALLWFVPAVGLTLAGGKIFRKKYSKI